MTNRWQAQVGTDFFILVAETGRWLFRVRTNNAGRWYVQRNRGPGSSWTSAGTETFETANQGKAWAETLAV